MGGYPPNLTALTAKFAHGAIIADSDQSTSMHVRTSMFALGESR